MHTRTITHTHYILEIRFSNFSVKRQNSPRKYSMCTYPKIFPQLRKTKSKEICPT